MWDRCGIGDTMTSPPRFGPKSKLGFVPWARVFSCSLHTCDGEQWRYPMAAPGCAGWPMAQWETNCVQVKSRQSQGPCAWGAALGSTGAGFPHGGVGDTGSEEQSVGRGSLTAWGC